MKKIKKISILISLFGLILLAPHDAKALSLDVLANQGISASKSEACSTGYCYNTNNEYNSTHYSSYRYNIYGFRVSLIDKNTGNIVNGSRSVDYIPGLSCSGDIKNRRNCFSATTKYNETDLIYILGKDGDKTYKRIKQDYIRTNWAAADSELLNALEARKDEGIDVSENSWFFNKFITDLGTQDSAAQLGSPAVTTAFKRRLDKLKETYNKGPEDSGKNEVFGTGSDKDAVHAIVREILGNNDLSEDQVKDYLKSCNIQIEIITRIDLGLNFYGKGFKRYHIIGTTSDIYAFALYVSKNYFQTSDLFGRAVTFLYDLHNSFYTTESLYGYDAGNSTICNTENMNNQNKSSSAFSLLGNETFACGVATISGLESTPVCKIEEVDGNKVFYGSDGQKMSGTILGCTAGSTEECYKEHFISTCGCDKSKEFGLDSMNYWQNQCSNSSDKGTKICKPTVTNRNCSGTLEVKDDEDCVFNSINKDVMSDTTNSKTHTKYTNEYCSVACAEDIIFEFPTRIDAQKAGTYFKWSSDTIKATGKRTCKAVYDWSNIGNKLTNTISSGGVDTKSVIDTIYSGYGQFSDAFIKNETGYSLIQQNEALKNFHDSFAVTSSQKEDTTLGTNTKKYYVSTMTSDYSTDTFKYYECKTRSWNDKTESYSNWSNYESCGGTYSSSYTSNGKNDGTSLDSVKTKIAEKIGETASNIGTEIDKVNACLTNFNGIGDTYDFSPIVTFSYDEPYTKFFGKEFTESDTTTNSNPDGTNQRYTSYYQNIGYYTNNTGTITNTSKSLNRPTEAYNYMSNSVSKTITYSSPITFYTSTPTGIIVTEDGGNYSDTEGKTYTHIRSINEDGNDIFPIALTTLSGNDYKYNLLVSNLGDQDMLNARSNKGRMDGFFNKDNLNYYCYYSVSKDVTVNPNAQGEKLNFFYRNVSLNNFDPNNREGNNQLGYNWNTEKGKKTMCLITGGTYELDGTCRPKSNPAPEEIYDEKAEYSFTLTPEKMKEIRSYNKTQQKYGGFNDFNMTKLENEGEGYWYTSDFIRNPSNFADSDISPKWELWTDGVGKLTGTGPAWK